MIIRPEAPSDRAAIRSLVIAAFGGVAEADLVERLRGDGDLVLSLVAEAEGGILGHALLSRMAAPFRALGLAPVAVRPEAQGAGIGGRLIRTALAQAERDGWRAVFVLGDPAYYGRFGFDAALAAGFASAYSGPHLMARALGGPLPARAGRIDYAPAFAALG